MATKTVPSHETIQKMDEFGRMIMLFNAFWKIFGEAFWRWEMDKQRTYFKRFDMLEERLLKIEKLLKQNIKLPVDEPVKYTPSEYKKYKKDVLNYLLEHPNTNTEEILTHLQIPAPILIDILEELKSKGLIEYD